MNHQAQGTEGIADIGIKAVPDIIGVIAVYQGQSIIGRYTLAVSQYDRLAVYPIGQVRGGKVDVIAILGVNRDIGGLQVIAETDMIPQQFQEVHTFKIEEIAHLILIEYLIGAAQGFYLFYGHM